MQHTEAANIHKNRNLRSISVLAVFLLVAVGVLVPVAYAYHSEVDSECSVGSRYASVNIYTYKGTDSPATVQFDDSSFDADSSLTFDGSGVTYVKSGSNYTIKGTASLTGHYVAVFGNATGLKLSAKVTESDEGTVHNISYTLSIGGTSLAVDGSGSIPVTAGTAYSISLVADLNSTGYSSGTLPVLPTVTLSFSIVDEKSSVEIQKISIKYTSVNEEDDLIHANSDKGISTKSGDDNPSYTENGDTFYIVPNNNRSDGYASVYITEGNDTTNYSSATSYGDSETRTTTLTIPSGKSFVVEAKITFDSIRIFSGASINLSLTIGDNTYTGSMSKSGDYYFYISSGTTLSTTSSLSSITKWMTGDNVQLSITGSNRDILVGSTISVQIVMM